VDIYKEQAQGASSPLEDNQWRHSPKGENPIGERTQSESKFLQSRNSSPKLSPHFKVTDEGEATSKLGHGRDPDHE
jgi:hypothetical protein